MIIGYANISDITDILQSTTASLIFSLLYIAFNLLVPFGMYNSRIVDLSVSSITFHWQYNMSICVALHMVSSLLTITYTIFTWLNAVATITLVQKLVQQLFKLNHHSIWEKNF